MTDEFSYHAFISHAHEDFRTARWLHRSLEAFRLPSGVRLPPDSPLVPGSKPFYPCFLDREEVHGGLLSEQIVEALRQSRNLIVLCSLHSRESDWVNREVAQFLKHHPVARVFPVLTGDTGGLQEVDLFPASLSEALQATQGEIGAFNLLAIDLRETGDGARRGLFKLVAGTSGVLFRDLVARQAARNRRIRGLWAGFVLAAVLAGVQVTVTYFDKLGHTQRAFIERITKAQIRIYNSAPDSFEIRSPDGFLLGFYCSMGEGDILVGATGCVDEQHGEISPSYAVGFEGAYHDQKVYAGAELAREAAAELIRADRRFTDDWYSSGELRSFDIENRRTLITDNDEVFYFTSISLEPRGEFFRRAWFIIWHGSISHFVLADTIRLWGRSFAVATFVCYFAVEHLPMRRFLHWFLGAWRSRGPISLRNPRASAS